MTKKGHLIAPICGNCGKEIDKRDGGWWHVADGRMPLRLTDVASVLPNETLTPTEKRSSDMRLRKCGAVFRRPPLMGWAPDRCERKRGHSGTHRFTAELNVAGDPSRLQRLVCTWTDETKPNPRFSGSGGS